jgi:hypothetical protein
MDKWARDAADEIVRLLPHNHQPGSDELAIIIWRSYTREKGPPLRDTVADDQSAPPPARWQKWRGCLLGTAGCCPTRKTSKEVSSTWAGMLNTYQREFQPESWTLTSPGRQKAPWITPVASYAGVTRSIECGDHKAK